MNLLVVETDLFVNDAAYVRAMTQTVQAKHRDQVPDNVPASKKGTCWCSHRVDLDIRMGAEGGGSIRN